MARIEFLGSRTIGRLARRVLPRSLLGRSLLMILLPLMLLEAVALQLFYGSHLDVVSRRLTGNVASGLAYTLELVNRHPDDQQWILDRAQRQCDMALQMELGASLATTKWQNVIGPAADDLVDA